RDLMLERLSGITDIQTEFSADGSVRAWAGDKSGPALVEGGTSLQVGMTAAADGTLAFSVGGTAVDLKGGALTGHALTLEGVAQARTDLDGLAKSIIDGINGAQVQGSDVRGNPGVVLFTGDSAGTIKVPVLNGDLIATADAGADPRSRDTATLDKLRAALAADGGAAERMSTIVFGISSQVAGHKITTEALDAIASSARISLEQQAGVDLDTEAANLIRYQQAFQASGRAMQVASDIFQSLLGIG